MSHYHLNQALARRQSTNSGCWTGIAPTTTSKTQYWLNYCTIWIQPTSMLRCPVLVQRWSTLSRCWPSVAPTIVQKTRYATCTLTHLQQSLTAPSCNRTTALVERRANTISSHEQDSYEQDVGPTLGQCSQLVSFIYKYAIFPVDLSD